MARLWLGPDSLAQLAKTLQRTPPAVYEHARRIGLQLGVPTGFETLKAAARRCGFDLETMRHVVRSARVELHAVRRRTPPYDAPPTHAYLWPADADDAVARWLRAETVTAAARRTGVHRTTLRRWLLRIGARPPRRGLHWRVDGVVVARAVRAVHGTERQMSVTVPANGAVP